MRRVITYGTFDLFHEGHYRLLERAKKLGDYLIVGVTTASYDDSRGKLNVQEGLMRRIENVRSSGLVDEIIIEEYEGQKVDDILKYHIDVFAIGSDWIDKFDYLKNYCEVVYLERTKGISSTELRAKSQGIMRIGLVGCNGAAAEFVKESRYVSGVNVEGVYGSDKTSLQRFANVYELPLFSVCEDEFVQQMDSIYIAYPHPTHYDLAKKALTCGKHVICQKPLVGSVEQCHELYELAKDKGCVLLDGIRTAYLPGFVRLISIAKSGLIGQIKSIDATFTKLGSSSTLDPDIDITGGSIIELAPYPLLAIVKLLGVGIKDVDFCTYYEPGYDVDMFTRINLVYRDAIASATVGLGVNSEGTMIISGTKGCIVVTSPWWRTEYFETRFENALDNKKYYCKLEGNGLRYELAEFVSMVNRHESHSYKLMPKESEAICMIIEQFLTGKKIRTF